MVIFRGLLSLGMMLSLPAAAYANSGNSLTKPDTQAVSATENRHIKPIDVITGINTGLNVYNTLNNHFNQNSSPNGVSNVTGPLSQTLGVANVAIQFWDIIQKNKPTVAIDTKVASALPNGADQDWRNLSGWQAERAIQFETVIHSSLYKTEEIHLTYEVRLLFGGNLNGKGRYIASARVVPTSIKVNWGYDLNVKVIVASVYNAGTAEDPVGAINLEVQYTYGTVFKNSTQTNSFLLRGDGLIQDRTSGKIFYQPYTGEDNGQPQAIARRVPRKKRA